MLIEAAVAGSESNFNQYYHGQITKFQERDQESSAENGQGKTTGQAREEGLIVAAGNRQFAVQRNAAQQVAARRSSLPERFTKSHISPVDQSRRRAVAFGLLNLGRCLRVVRNRDQTRVVGPARYSSLNAPRSPFPV